MNGGITYFMPLIFLDLLTFHACVCSELLAFYAGQETKYLNWLSSISPQEHNFRKVIQWDGWPCSSDHK